MIVVLAGGVGAARYLSGLVDVVDAAELVVIVNTGDDDTVHGLFVSPDLDTITYTLAGASDRERGWGLGGESWQMMGALERYDTPTWFRLGDVDLATHLYRTERILDGAPLDVVTSEIAAAWGLRLRIVPMSNDPVRTRLRLTSGEEVSFQEYFVKLSHDVAVSSVRFVGCELASPAPGVLDALESAERILIAPSNPIVSIGPIVAIEEIAKVLRARRDDVVAVSPIVQGAALKGPADRLLVELGGRSSVAGVAAVLTPYAATLVIDTADAHLAPEVEAEEMRAVVTKTVMHSPEIAQDLARVALVGTSYEHKG